MLAAHFTYGDSNMTQPIKIIKGTEVSRRFCIGRTALYEKCKPGSPYYDPSFPLPVALGNRAVGWYEHELEQWARNRPRVSPEDREKKSASGVAGMKAKRAAKKAETA